MILEQILLKNFRNFSQSVFYFNPFLTIIVGKNSVGKTNLLEVIYFSASGRGFREKKEEELIYYNKSTADVQTVLTEEKEKTLLRIYLHRNKTILKKYFLNKTKKANYQYLAQSLPAVIFSPSLMYVIEGEPVERRDYFNNLISDFDLEYKKRLINFEKALRRRNKILEIEKNIEKVKQELVFWDGYLIKQANYLVKKRQELVDFLNQHPKLDNKIFAIKYIKNELSEETLNKTFEKQLILKKTLVGPQRDDFEILIYTSQGLKNIHQFGSRSEQRLSLFWLVLNEVALYQEILKKRPLLLLDDIFSELDTSNKELVIKLIKKQQTIITTTQPEILDLIDIPHSIINLK
jgi:DNA replication and repair protein RecF